jgi:hypothetical protein
MYDGTDFILEAREVRLKLTYIELGRIWNYCTVIKTLPLVRSSVYLQTSTPIPQLKRCASKILKHYKIIPRSLPVLESTDEETQTFKVL